MYTFLADHETIKGRSPKQIFKKGKQKGRERESEGEKRKDKKEKERKEKEKIEGNHKGIFSGAFVPYALNSRPPTSLRIFHLFVAAL